MQLAPIWISTDTALPDYDEVVILRIADIEDSTPGIGVNFGYRCEEHGWHNLDGQSLSPPAYVSHWSPMPVDRPATSN